MRSNLGQMLQPRDQIVRASGSSPACQLDATIVAEAADERREPVGELGGLIDCQTIELKQENERGPRARHSRPVLILHVAHRANYRAQPP
jgi:hypothetical protein